MKIKSLLLSSFLATSLFAESYFEYDPTLGNINKVNPDSYGNTVLAISKSGALNADNLARFSWADADAMKSLTTDLTNAPTNFAGFDIVGGFNVNLFTATAGEYKALDLKGNVRFIGYKNGEIDYFRIYNYDGKIHPTNTVALASVDSLTIANAAVLKIETNTRLTGDKVVIDHDKSGIVVSSGTLEYQVKETNWNRSHTYLQVDQGATFKMMTPADMKVNAGTIAGNFINDTTNSLLFEGKYAMVLADTGLLFSKGRLKISGKVEVSGDMIYTSNNGSLLMNATGELTLNKRNALQSATLSTKAEYDADVNRDKTFLVLQENGSDVYYKLGGTTVVATGGSNVLNINARNSFALTFSAAERLTINIASDATLVLTNITFAGKDTESVVTLNNFENDAIFLLSNALNGYDKIYDFSVFDAEGNEYSKADMALVAGNFEGLSGYWLTVPALAVPEPAEWAMIFGGIALGLAIYRRRK